MDTNDADFDEFFRRTYRRLLAFLIKQGYTHEVAENAVAEAMTQALVQWSRIEWPAAWVRVAAARIAGAQAGRERAGRDKVMQADWAMAGLVDGEVELVKDEQQQVLAELRRLPPNQRLVMAWTFDGFTPSEIAEHLGMRESTVRSHLRHARLKLRSRLRPPGASGVRKEG